MRKRNIIISMGIVIIFIFVIVFCSFNKSNLETMQSGADEAKVVEVFEGFFEEAEEKLKDLSLEERIGQIFLVRYPEEGAVDNLLKYKFGGYLLFERDFKDKTEEEIKSEIAVLQENSSIPLLIAADEEGGKVVRISSNQNLTSEKFKSPSELYNLGGFEKIKEDTIEKSRILYNLGVNLNLAPVVDVSTNSKDYIYPRTLGENTQLTSEYAEVVISSSKAGKVSYALKHFPGYGSNIDTHKGSAVDNKSYDEILANDLPPFKAGIEAGAEAVLVSHNIVNCIDAENPASLSRGIHEILREKLGFRGVVITDDLDMGATLNDQDRVIKAILAGNDLLIVTDYEKAINDTKKALEEGIIDESLINEAAKRILAWKYYKGMMWFHAFYYFNIDNTSSGRYSETSLPFSYNSIIMLELIFPNFPALI